MNIIPNPLSVKRGKGSFLIKGQTKICIDAGNNDFRKQAELLSERFEKVAGFKLEIVNNKEVVPAIRFSVTRRPDIGREGYTLSVNENGIDIKASGKEGFFYGIQTLFQLLPAQIYSKNKILGVEWSVPYAEIKDAPRFSWRGMHLDVSRHFFPVEFIKRYIDYIAMHKMNVFHWHLTDDNGWRIEIKKHPKLTSVSAWRTDQEDRQWNDRPPCDPAGRKVYGGFYTQEQIREIVAYAADRQVTVVPEIEMPGHVSEVLAAYPELGCTGGVHYVKSGGYWPNVDIFCAGNDKVFSFLEDVLDEVTELFPSEYIHVGGDEADKIHWRSCPKCQARIKVEGLGDEAELQGWFMKRIQKHLVSRGRKLIGWDEILEGGLATGSAVMIWHGTEYGIRAAKMGHDVVMTPVSHCYFDFYQNHPELEKEASGGYTTLKKVYSYEPVPECLTGNEKKRILGAQGNVWTEYMPEDNHVEYMIMPRMSALSEVLWSPAGSRSWSNFLGRIQEQFRRFDFAGINYCRGTEIAGIKVNKDQSTGKVYIEMESELPGAEVCFTLDGTVPNQTSPLYSGLVEIEGPVTVKAVVVMDGKPLRKSVSVEVDPMKSDLNNLVEKILKSP